MPFAGKDMHAFPPSHRAAKLQGRAWQMLRASVDSRDLHARIREPNCTVSCLCYNEMKCWETSVAEKMPFTTTLVSSGHLRL